jgi:hypothetical protein
MGDSWKETGIYIYIANFIDFDIFMIELWYLIMIWLWHKWCDYDMIMIDLIVINTYDVKPNLQPAIKLNAMWGGVWEWWICPQKIEVPTHNMGR